MNHLRVATWNVNCWNPNRAEQKLALLQLVDWDVALLQEVNSATFAKFTGGDFRGVHAVDLLGGPWHQNAHGAAILVRGETSIAAGALVPLEPSKAPTDDGKEVWRRARIMTARLRWAGQELTAVSFHAPDAAGADDNEREPKIAAKMRLFRSLHSWSREAQRPLVVGMDGNVWEDSVEPMRLDPTHTFHDQRRFHNAGADHGLRDALHEHLTRNRPDLLERQRRLGVRPEDGALAVTYQRSSNKYPKVNRMDRIYVSSDFTVRNVETLYDDALTVGSDHALVVAHLMLDPGEE